MSTNRKSYKIDIEDVNAKVAIATALVLIALLLAYIAFYK